MYISFVDDKPIVGEAAKKALKEKPTFVIYGNFQDGRIHLI